MDQSSSSQAEATKNAGLPKQTELMHMGSSSNKTISLGSGSNQDAATGNEGPRRMPRDLYAAAVAGNVKDVKEKYAEHLDLQLTPNKNTVLHVHIAAQLPESSKSTTFVEEILDMCPSLLRQANTVGDTPLHIAARYGLSDIVKALIELTNVLHELESGTGKAGEMLRMRNNEDDTALHEAVRYGHTEVVSLLTKDPNISYSANDACETPLYLAVERGFHDVVDVILKNCTSPAYNGPYGRTALHAAVICNDLEMAKKLLGPKLTLPSKEADQDGRTPLHYAACLGCTKEMVSQLLNSDESTAYLADKESKKTALHIAASHGHSNIMEELVSRCPDCCELVDSKGWNALHYAAVSTKDYEAMKRILSYPSVNRLINEKDADGNTPIHLCFDSDNYIDIIVNHPGVDGMALNMQNKTPPDMSTSEGKFKAPDNSKRSWGQGRRSVVFKDVSYKEGKAEDKEVKDTKTRETEEARISNLKKASETHLIVATLIATVTFAAAFTMPGGYIDQDGPVPGTPILTRKAAFKAFVIIDTIAMALSTSAVLLHFSMAINTDVMKLRRKLIWAATLTINAMLAMVIAFMTGMYVVLAHSPGLAVASCVITACCFFISYRHARLRHTHSFILAEMKLFALQCIRGLLTKIAKCLHATSELCPPREQRDTKDAR